MIIFICVSIQGLDACGHINRVGTSFLDPDLLGRNAIILVSQVEFSIPFAEDCVSFEVFGPEEGD